MAPASLSAAIPRTLLRVPPVVASKSSVGELSLCLIGAIHGRMEGGLKPRVGQQRPLALGRADARAHGCAGGQAGVAIGARALARAAQVYGQHGPAALNDESASEFSGFRSPFSVQNAPGAGNSSTSLDHMDVTSYPCPPSFTSTAFTWRLRRSCIPCSGLPPNQPLRRSVGCHSALGVMS